MCIREAQGLYCSYRSRLKDSLECSWLRAFSWQIPLGMTFIRKPPHPSPCPFLDAARVQGFVDAGAQRGLALFPQLRTSSQEPSHLQSSGWDGLSLHPASSSTKVCLHLLFRTGLLRVSLNKCLTQSSQSLISRYTSLKQHIHKNHLYLYTVIGNCKMKLTDAIDYNINKNKICKNQIYVLNYNIIRSQICKI